MKSAILNPASSSSPASGPTNPSAADRAAAARPTASLLLEPPKPHRLGDLALRKRYVKRILHVWQFRTSFPIRTYALFGSIIRIYPFGLTAVQGAAFRRSFLSYRLTS